MPDSPHIHDLAVNVSPDGVLIVDGDIDIAGGPILAAAIQLLGTDRPLVIDLERVGFLDSSGLRTLLSAAKRAESRDQRVTLQNVRPEVFRLFDLTRTSMSFDFHTDERSRRGK